jgi:RNA polymerase sigma factor for flagellar operon FliA
LRARNTLIEENLAFVGYLVNDVWSRATHLSRDELASAGALGLVMAAESFDESLGVPFGAYARRRILGAIADDMRSADWATRTTRKRIKESLSVQESLTAALGRVPSVDELASALGTDRQSVSEALADASRTVTHFDDSIADQVAADVAGPEEGLMVDERRRYVLAAVTALPERMRYIVEQVYFGERTVGEIAAELGMTHSAVSQQRAEAVRLMRDGLEQHYPDAPAASDVEPVVHSRIAPARRSAYVARFGEYVATQALRAETAASLDDGDRAVVARLA